MITGIVAMDQQVTITLGLILLTLVAGGAGVLIGAAACRAQAR